MASTRHRLGPRVPKLRVRHHGVCAAGHEDTLHGEDAELPTFCTLKLRDDDGRGHIIGVCHQYMTWTREEYLR